MSEQRELTIKEELRWVYLVVRNHTVWGEYLTKEEAEQAIDNIERNERWMKHERKN